MAKSKQSQVRSVRHKGSQWIPLPLPLPLLPLPHSRIILGRWAGPLLQPQCNSKAITQVCRT